MKVDKILPCVCTEEEELVSLYDGMPVLLVCGGKPHTYFTPYCPKCGLGRNKQYESAFLALRAWNEMQETMKSPADILKVVEECD